MKTLETKDLDKLREKYNDPNQLSESIIKLSELIIKADKKEWN